MSDENGALVAAYATLDHMERELEAETANLRLTVADLNEARALVRRLYEWGPSNTAAFRDATEAIHRWDRGVR